MLAWSISQDYSRSQRWGQLHSATPQCVWW